MLVGANIFGGRTHHDPLIYRDLARQANGYGCSAGGKPSPAYRPDLYPTANRDARMGDLYTAYLDGLRDAGASLACLYASHYAPQKYGNWGLREHVGQPDAEAPKAAAVRAWMVANPVVEPEPTPEPTPEPDPAPDPEPPVLALLASIDLMVDADGVVTLRARRPAG